MKRFGLIFFILFFSIKSMNAQIDVNAFMGVYNCSMYQLGNPNPFTNTTMTVTPHNVNSPYFVLNCPMNGTAAPIRPLLLHNDSTFVDSLGVIGIGGWDGYFYKVDSIYLIVHLPSGNSNRFYGKKMTVTDINDFGMSNSIKIFPNPANDLVTVSSRYDFEKVELLSVTGQVLLTETVNSKSHQLQLQNFSEGIYFAKVVYPDGLSLAKKIIKQ